MGIYTEGTNKDSDVISYEITDHLGNVRTVVSKELEATVIKSYADYYPFGEQLPGRNAFSDYRYAFQGQEKDDETGMEAFHLRLWDGRLGRWLSPDPYGQYTSPYLGMGNNPVNMIDPDGGFAEGCCPDPPTDGGVLNEVIVLSGKAKNYLNDFSQKFIANFAGFGNAFGSNMVLGAGRFDAERWSNASTRMNYRYGQLAGDISSMVWGAGEMFVGGTMAAGGVVLVPFTGGTSLVGTAAGATIAAHGTSVIVLGGINTAKDIKGISDSFAKSGHSSSGGGGNLDGKYAGKTANEIITKYRKGSVRDVFPEELLESTWEQIKTVAASGKKNYQTAKKLLTDGRFSK